MEITTDPSETISGRPYFFLLYNEADGMVILKDKGDGTIQSPAKYKDLLLMDTWATESLWESQD